MRHKPRGGENLPHLLYSMQEYAIECFYFFLIPEIQNLLLFFLPTLVNSLISEENLHYPWELGAFI
jgi:hypothetical protein